ncbi:MAG: hypothetical protein ACREBH_00130 [Candidatus Micrarchaeaceae archaeon]
MAQIYRVEYGETKFSRREQLIMLEIGRDTIDTASSFVDYMNEEYGFSKSSTWYCLNSLKDAGVLGFANRMDMGKPLSLTRQGISELGRLERNKISILSEFNDTQRGFDSASIMRSVSGYPRNHASGHHRPG